LSTTLTLFEPELYHGTGQAYFGTLVRRPTSSGNDTRLLGKCYPVETLTEWLKLVHRSPWDTYISQGEFERTSRTVAALRTIGLVWADIGDDGVLASYGEAAAVHRILKVVDEVGIPAPSLILFSGRGYHVKWFFESAVPSEKLTRWDEAERAITAALREDLNADPKAIDAARVLRVAETTNNKSGLIARIVWVNWVNGKPLQYDFDDLCYEVIAEAKSPQIYRSDLDTPPQKRKRAATGFSKYSAASLWWTRFHDLRRLNKMRLWTPERGGVEKGYRDMMLFIGAVGLAYVCPRQNWWNELAALATEFCPRLPRKEWEGYMKPTFVRLMKSFTRGERECRYRMRNSYIINVLGISREEQASLKILVDDDIAKARNVVKAREGMAALRGSEEKRAAKAQRNADILDLLKRGTHVDEIARLLGVSRRTVYNVATASAD
jgi:hypothetical protein